MGFIMYSNHVWEKPKKVSLGSLDSKYIRNMSARSHKKPGIIDLEKPSWNVKGGLFMSTQQPKQLTLQLVHGSIRNVINGFLME